MNIGQDVQIYILAAVLVALALFFRSRANRDWKFALYSAAIAAVLLAVVARACTNWYEYYYMSFADVAGITVVAYGTPPPSRTGSSYHRSMPVVYRLARDGYDIVIEVDYANPVPMAIIGAEDSAGWILRVEDASRKDDLRCGNVDFLIYRYSEFGILGEAKPSLRYVRNMRGTYSVTSSCLGELDDTGLQIRLRVLDDSGGVLGEETLPFRIVRNGMSSHIDAI